MVLSEKELKLAEQLKLYNIDIEGVIKRGYYDTEYCKVIGSKIEDFCFESICLTAETFTHYVPQVYSKVKFYRLAVMINGELKYEYFGKDAKSMNENYLKLKKHCEG